LPQENAMPVWTAQGGSGEDLTVLLHGMGASSCVWAPLVERICGRWLAVDLPGHGRSAPIACYDPLPIAIAVGRALAERIPQGQPLAILGHSLGGAVGLELASGNHGIAPDHCHVLGIKVDWPGADIERMATIASRRPRIFGSAAEAQAAALKMAGVSAEFAGHIDGAGLVREVAGGKWQVALDMQVFAQQDPHVARLVAAARCPVSLARGAGDEMVSLAQLQAINTRAVEIASAGHNAMIEQPEAVARWAGLNLRQPPG
jgi:pimeloyl-ACP methyl ester carboxylesterase